MRWLAATLLRHAPVFRSKLAVRHMVPPGKQSVPSRSDNAPCKLTPSPDLESVPSYVQELADLRADLLVLLVEAGVAHPNVMPDDPISILRMFLPGEGD